jgi:3'(2'), 5'-bisphosphate nucleotidase
VPAFDLAACSALMEGMTRISIAAAAAIFQTRNDRGFRVKADGSPVTRADEASETVIRDSLSRLAPNLPIISEERAENEKPAGTHTNYFLVDPLDGTREFIAGRDEYTINIGLICDAAPLAGVVVAPALGRIWRGITGRGAERLDFSAGKTSAPLAIHARRRIENELIVMVSRSHLDAQTEAYLRSLPHARRVACGSSIKFCLLAEGVADHYPRLGPMRDWDVAAGHAVLSAAGGSVIDPSGTALRYGTPDLRIPAILAWGAPAPGETGSRT